MSICILVRTSTRSAIASPAKLPANATFRNRDSVSRAPLAKNKNPGSNVLGPGLGTGDSDKSSPSKRSPRRMPEVEKRQCKTDKCTSATSPITGSPQLPNKFSAFAKPNSTRRRNNQITYNKKPLAKVEAFR